MRNPLVIDAKKKLFLAAFSRHGSLVQAERETGINRQRHYHWHRVDAQYRIDFARARKRAASAILNRIKELPATPAAAIPEVVNA